MILLSGEAVLSTQNPLLGDFLEEVRKMLLLRKKIAQFRRCFVHIIQSRSNAAMGRAL